MAKRRINDYKFIPGIPTTGNLYPNAWAQTNANQEYLKDEATAYILLGSQLIQPTMPILTHQQELQIT